jgi:Asp-tRNA(Asn)/Glu-tRNA(Gln) amidotransferase A subunit family amidase
MKNIVSSDKIYPIRPDATTLLEELRAGKTSSEEVVKAHLEQLNKVQPTVNGAIKVFEKEALALARKLDQTGDKALPLFGLPCSIKETFAMEGEEITAGSIRRVPDQCTEDAEMVKRLRATGAVIIARSNIPEFAMTGETTNLRFGRCSNPLDVTRVAGGSSGGEGALVGSGSSVFGIGSDILGSIRIPAALCGTVGFKAHSKAIDSTGTWPNIKTSLRDWLGYGPICRSVRDAQLIYNVLAEKPEPETTEIFKNLIIPEGFPIKYRQRCIEDAVNTARKAVTDKGMDPIKEDFNDISDLFLNIPKIIMDEFYDIWIEDLSSSPKFGQFSPSKEILRNLIGKPTIDGGLLNLILMKPIMKSRQPEKRKKIANSFIEARSKYRQLLGEDRVMIMPTLGLVAPKHKGFNRASLLNPGVNGLFTSHTLGNYLDLSVVCVPAWKFCDPKTGLPPSISLLCAPGAEGRLFATAKIVEAALNKDY